MSTPDARQFRNTIGLFATGVAVIVAKANQEVLAMTANAVSSVSLDPMLVMFCPSKRSNLAKHLAHLSAFTINILRHDQQALSTFLPAAGKSRSHRRSAWFPPVTHPDWREAWPPLSVRRGRSTRLETTGWCWGR